MTPVAGNDSSWYGVTLCPWFLAALWGGDGNRGDSVCVEEAVNAEVPWTVSGLLNWPLLDASSSGMAVTVVSSGFVVDQSQSSNLRVLPVEVCVAVSSCCCC
jgi:hypothetical protein